MSRDDPAGIQAPGGRFFREALPAGLESAREEDHSQNRKDNTMDNLTSAKFNFVTRTRTLLGGGHRK